MRTNFMRGVMLSSALALLACSAENDTTGEKTSTDATHSGIVSIQDVTIQGAKELGHGLSVTVLFTKLRAPNNEDGGCRIWLYDAVQDPAPELTDQGVIEIDGLEGGPYGCNFSAGSGYFCPTALGSGQVNVSMGQPGTSTYEIEGAAFSQADVGRYLRVVGAMNPKNDGVFPIVAAPSSDRVVLANPAGSEEKFTSEYTVLAGVGPVPNNPHDPFAPGSAVTIGITPGGARAFDFADVALTPGEAFQLDTASQSTLTALALDGASVTLGCNGAGGECGNADASIVRITSTDGDTTGLSPFAMPAPVKKHAEIQCAAENGATSVTIPASITGLFALWHADAPPTRVRTAFMRDGFGYAANSAGKPQNQAILAVGRGVIGYSNP
jgi:hypothetical protein